MVPRLGYDLHHHAHALRGVSALFYSFKPEPWAYCSHQQCPQMLLQALKMVGEDILIDHLSLNVKLQLGSKRQFRSTNTCNNLLKAACEDTAAAVHTHLVSTTSGYGHDAARA